MRLIPRVVFPLAGLALLGLAACSSRSPAPTPADEPAVSAESTVHAATATDAPAASTNEKPSEKLVNCTARIAPGEDPTPHLRPGATVCFAEGRHAVNLRIEVPVTLVGEPGAILDGGGSGPVIHIAKDKIVVRVESLTLTNGYAEFGSGMYVDGYAKLTLHDLTFSGNQAGRGGGVGLGAQVGMLTMSGCRFQDGDDLILTNITKAEVTDTTADKATILDGAKVTWTGGKVGELTLRGTTTRAPEVTLKGVEGTVNNDPNLPATLTQE